MHASRTTLCLILLAISLALVQPIPAHCDLAQNDAASAPPLCKVQTHAQEIGDIKSFWAYDFDAEEMYIVDAHLLAIGDHCYIYFDDLAIAIIGEGTAKLEDLDLLQELAEGIRDLSLCQLGATAPNPVLTTLAHFRDEYEAHIYQGKYPAGVCKALTTYLIDAEKCTGCTLCARNCPAAAVQGEKTKPHTIDQSKCTKCAICRDVCKFNAMVLG